MTAIEPEALPAATPLPDAGEPPEMTAYAQDELTRHIDRRRARLRAIADAGEPLRELRALSEAATPGPWKFDGIDVYEDGGEIQINVTAPDGLVATFPTGVMALSEVQWATADNPETERNARWDEAKTKPAGPDATLAVAAVNYVRALLDEAPAGGGETERAT